MLNSNYEDFESHRWHKTLLKAYVTQGQALTLYTRPDQTMHEFIATRQANISDRSILNSTNAEQMHFTDRITKPLRVGNLEANQNVYKQRLEAYLQNFFQQKHYF